MFKTELQMPYDTKIIKMSDMKPGQMGKIIEGSIHINSVIMRTFNTMLTEVMNLSSPGINSCWTNIKDRPDIKVQLLPKGSKIILEVL